LENRDGTFSGRQRRRQSQEEFEVYGKETKIAFDEPLPGEPVVIILFALFIGLEISLLLG
jgi:hypothetical protein